MVGWYYQSTFFSSAQFFNTDHIFFMGLQHTQFFSFKISCNDLNLIVFMFCQTNKPFGGLVNF